MKFQKQNALKKKIIICNVEGFHTFFPLGKVDLNILDFLNNYERSYEVYLFWI